MKKSKGKYPKRMKFRRLTAVFMAAAVVLSGMALPSKTAEAAETEYEIYPSPHVMEYTEGSYSMKYFVNINGGSFVDCYQLKEFSKAQIIKVFMNIDKMISPIRSQMEKGKRWNVLTLIVDASGKFRTEFDYADISENTISYHEAWKEKYLK